MVDLFSLSSKPEKCLEEVVRKNDPFQFEGLPVLHPSPHFYLPLHFVTTLVTTRDVSSNSLNRDVNEPSQNFKVPGERIHN